MRHWRTAILGLGVLVPCLSVATVNVASSISDDTEVGTPPEARNPGAVTFEAYAEAFSNYINCLRESGYTVTVVDEPAAGRLADYRVPAAAVDEGVDESCYSTTFYAADIAYQRRLADLQHD